MEFTYKGLKGKLEKRVVKEEEVERQLHRLLQQNPRIAEIDDRPTENGDEVLLDYAGFCGDEQFAGGTAQNQTLVLGSGMFIPGFEEQLVDKMPGEAVTVKVTFPKEYHSEELAGKEARFECVIHKILVRTPYEMDDVFAKEIGGMETMDAFRKAMAESMQAYADQTAEMELQDDLLKQAAATLEYEPTAEEMEKAVDEQMRTLEAHLARQQLNIEMYCSFANTTVEQLRKDAEPSALAVIRNQAAIAKIVELEKVEAEQEDIAKTLQVICRQNNLTMEQLKEHYDEEFERAVLRSVITSKVMALIRENAQIEEVTVA